MSTMQYLRYYYKVIQSFFLSVLLQANVKICELGEDLQKGCKGVYNRSMRGIFKDRIVYFAVYNSGRYRIVYDYVNIMSMLYFTFMSFIKSIGNSFADMETIKIVGSLNKDETYYILKRFTDKGLETEVLSSNLTTDIKTKNDILFVLVNNKELYTKQIKDFVTFLHSNNSMTAREFMKMIDGYVNASYNTHPTGHHAVSLLTITIMIIDPDKVLHELVFKGEDIINIS